MKFILILAMLFAFNAQANDPPKADGKKPERSEVPERITRPKSTPDSLPHPVEKIATLMLAPSLSSKKNKPKLCAFKRLLGQTSLSLPRTDLEK